VDRIAEMTITVPRVAPTIPPIPTPRSKRLGAMANAYAEAKAVAFNPEMASHVMDRALRKSGYKVVKITRLELRQRAAGDGDA
jgi:hypothetical protein